MIKGTFCATINININNVNPEDYEDSNNTTNVSQDDVLGKAQKEKRGTGKGQKSKKVISNAVVQVENKNGSYIFVRESANKMFELIISFLIINNILNKHQLVFFSDGAR
ncbi:MAG: hypothetical protein LBV23_09835, partial [Deltaproteobacteria bacterium]|nr:hypothetical protein [Deltaproteobacteria bacterium]